MCKERLLKAETIMIMMMMIGLLESPRRDGEKGEGEERQAERREYNGGEGERD